MSKYLNGPAQDKTTSLTNEFVAVPIFGVGEVIYKFDKDQNGYIVDHYEPVEAEEKWKELQCSLA